MVCYLTKENSDLEILRAKELYATLLLKMTSKSEVSFSVVGCSKTEIVKLSFLMAIFIEENYMLLI